MTDQHICKCGSTDIRERSYVALDQFDRFKCRDCGGSWGAILPFYDGENEEDNLKSLVLNELEDVT